MSGRNCKIHRQHLMDALTVPPLMYPVYELLDG